MLLRLKDVRVHYGKAEAIQGITVDVEEGSITGLIGANGAGKSTVLKAISGLHPISAGEVWFRDKRIDGIAGHKIVQQGVLQIPERGRLFPFMTVMQNLRLGAYLRKDSGRIKDDLEKIFQRFPVLSLRRNQRAETLSGGERQMLAIGRALMAKPALMLLDEPSMGLSPKLVEVIAGTLQRLRSDGIALLLVEQNAMLTFAATSHCLVLENGEIALSGPSADLRTNPRIRRLYLGL